MAIRDRLRNARTALGLLSSALFLAGCGANTDSSAENDRMPEAVPEAPSAAMSKSEASPAATVMASPMVTLPPSPTVLVAAPTATMAQPEPVRSGLCGGENAQCCDDPNTCSPDGNCTLIGFDACGGTLSCCSGSCKVSCNGLNEDGTEATILSDFACDLTAIKACAEDTDCTTVSHVKDCCGTLRLMGISADQAEAYEEWAPSCIKQYTAPAVTCPCSPEPTTLDDFTIAVEPIEVRCVEGQCVTARVNAR